MRCKSRVKHVHEKVVMELGRVECHGPELVAALIRSLDMASSRVKAIVNVLEPLKRFGPPSRLSRSASAGAKMAKRATR